jgi:hypothetical protein
VQDAAFGMPALAGKVEFCFAVVCTFCKVDSKLYQLAYPLGAVFYNYSRDFFIRQTRADLQGVSYMGLKAVLAAPDRGNSALGIVRSAFDYLALGYNRYRAVLGSLKCEGQPGDA